MPPCLGPELSAGHLAAESKPWASSARARRQAARVNSGTHKPDVGWTLTQRGISQTPCTQTLPYAPRQATAAATGRAVLAPRSATVTVHAPSDAVAGGGWGAEETSRPGSIHDSGDTVPETCPLLWKPTSSAQGRAPLTPPNPHRGAQV